MRRLSLLVLLVAARAQAAPPAWLDPGSKQRFPERARPSAEAQLALIPGGPTVARAPAATLFTVVETGPPVRVIADADLIRVAFYVDPAALPRVARKGLVIVAGAGDLGPGAGVTRPGVRLRAGTVIEGVPAGEGQGLLRVTWSDGGKHVAVTGLAAAASTGATYVPEPEPRDVAGPLLLQGPVDVSATPGGAPFVAVSGDSLFDAWRLRARGGQALVRVPVEEGTVVGWVPSAALEKRGNMGRLFRPNLQPGTRAVGAYIGPSHAFHLSRGALLHAAPDGPPVGVVLAESPYEDFEKVSEGWVALTVAGPFGDLRLFTPLR